MYMPQYTITNMVQDGNFEAESSPWARSNATFAKKYSPGFIEQGWIAWFKPNVTSMMTQAALPPKPNHKYYGAILFSSSPTFTVADARFELYTADTPDGHLVFAQKNIKTEEGQFVKLSSIQSIPTVRSGNWILRNFTVNASADSYANNAVIVDLTALFGAGNEPSKEWCDANIPYVTGTVTVPNYGSRFAPTIAMTNYLLQNPGWEGSEGPIKPWVVPTQAQGSCGWVVDKDSVFEGRWTLQCEMTAFGMGVYQEVNAVPGHKYYCSLWMTDPPPQGQICFPVIFKGNTTVSELYKVPDRKIKRGVGYFYLRSAIVETKLTDEVDIFKFITLLDFNKNPGEYVYIDGCSYIDLTDIFGAGNEPSKQWMDVNFYYFQDAAIFNNKGWYPIYKKHNSWSAPNEAWVKMNRKWHYITDVYTKVDDQWRQGIIPFRNITLTNLVMDGSFADATKWSLGSAGSISTEKALYGTTSLKIDATSTTAPEYVIPSVFTITLNNTHKYYCRIYSNSNIQRNLDIYWPIAEPSFMAGKPLGFNEWTMVSAINTRTTFTNGDYPIRVDFNNGGAVGTAYYDGFMLIDLTNDFGDGNEPSKEWCDLNIPFFETEYNVFHI